MTDHFLFKEILVSEWFSPELNVCSSFISTLLLTDINMASSENTTTGRPAKHLRTLHEKEQEKRLIVILERSSLEAVKVSTSQTMEWTERFNSVSLLGCLVTDLIYRPRKHVTCYRIDKLSSSVNSFNYYSWIRF